MSTHSFSLRKTFAETVLELAESDESIVVLVGDISHGIFAKFREKFPNRYFNVGILEATMASVAAGFSMLGLKPIVHTIAPFLVERAFEQLKLDFGYQKLSAMFVSVGGAFDYSNLGCTHHSYFDLPMVGSIEGARVFSPASASDLRILMRQALETWSGLCYFKLTENGVEDYPNAISVKIGEPVLVREGTGKLAVISLGPAFVQVRDALNRLALSPHGNDVRHLHLHSFKPINFEMLNSSLIGVQHLAIVEHLASNQGLAGQVALGLEVPSNPKITGIGIAGFVRDYGTYEDLLNSSGLSAEALEQKMSLILGNLEEPVDES